MKYKYFSLLFFLLILSTQSWGQYTLTFNLTNMDPHLSQRFEVRITDKVNNNEVAHEVLEEITAAQFSFTFVALRQGRSYNVDFYADLNENGEYDSPPADHAWRLELNNVTTDRIINFAHNTNWTDVGWPANPTLGYLESIWGGKWHNLTFGSTDSIQVHIELDCDSFHMHLETKGLFGDPSVVTFEFWDAIANNIGSSTDTITINIDTPLAGKITIINGHFSAELIHPLFLVGLNFSGNFGTGQGMALYQVTNQFGVPFANGYFYIRELDVIDARSPISVDITNMDSVSCSGKEDGAITVQASGGLQPYTYEWTDGETGAQRDSLPSGTYTVIAADVNGCTDTLSINLPVGEELKIKLLRNDTTSCYDGEDGLLEILGVGGTQPYSYLWDEGQTTPLIDSLFSDEYFVTVTDAAGCQADSFFIVEEPDELDLTTTTTDETAPGSNDGTATTVAEGGTPDYTYIWSNGDTTAMITDLSAGLYRVTVTDANGCQSIDSARVAAFLCNISVDILGIDTVCFDSTTNLTASVMGGTPPYSFSWNTGDTTQNLDAVAGGITMVTVTDADGCIASDSLNIIRLSSITIMLTIVNESGFDRKDGSAIAHANGGLPPYSYAWNSGSMTDTASNLPPGMYDITVTDSYGCTSVEAFEIIAFVCDLQIDTILVTNETNSNSDGSISTEASGGTMPYTFEWTKDGISFSNSKDLSDLSAGKYVLRVEDDRGCVVTSDTILLQNITGTNDLTKTFNIYPNPASTWIKIEADFEWSLKIFNAQGIEVLSERRDNSSGIVSLRGLSPGIYLLTISDGVKSKPQLLIINS